MGDPFEVWRAPVVEDGYSFRRDWSTAVRVSTGCGSIQPTSADRTRVPRDTSMTIGRAYLPVTTDVAVSDRILSRGVWHDVVEDPELWRVGSRAHIRAVIQEITGGAGG